tara:strand:- start:1410 stop:1937 length:528 start_codon:yes stop_codon:yes gene_type:complete
MSSSNKGKQNLLKQSENKHIPGNYNKEISHSNYDTWKIKHTIEVPNSLDDLVISAINDVKEWFKESVKDKTINKVDFENSLDEILEHINYNGSLNEIVDNTVPIYTYELKGLFFINEDALIEAFENSGIGNKSDFENNPLGFEGVAIYCYIELEVNNWLSDNFEEWFSGKYWTVF